VARSCEPGNETSGSLKGGGIDQLRVCGLFKEDFVPWNSFALLTTWTTRYGAKGGDNLSSGDDVFMIHLSFLSVFLLPGCCG
jgi:hypothetical protein